VDLTTWPRCDAECSPCRGYYYHPSRHSAGQPIIAGWAYQWIAQVGLERDSWTAPVDAAGCIPWMTPTRPPPPRSTRCWSGSRPAPTAAPSRAGRPLDLAGLKRPHPAAPGPPRRLRPAPAMGAAPTTAAAVTGAGPPRVSPAAGPTGLASERAETRRMPARPAKRSLLGSRQPLPGDQEARQEAQEQAAQDRKGRLIGPPILHDRRPQSTISPASPGANHKLRACANRWSGRGVWTGCPSGSRSWHGGPGGRTRGRRPPAPARTPPLGRGEGLPMVRFPTCPADGASDTRNE
jgi:hypothetical protein